MAPLCGGVPPQSRLSFNAGQFAIYFKAEKNQMERSFMLYITQNDNFFMVPKIRNDLRMYEVRTFFKMMICDLIDVPLRSCDVQSRA